MDICYNKLKLIIRKHIFEYMLLNNVCFINIKFSSDMLILINKLMDTDILLCTATSFQSNDILYIYDDRIELINEKHKIVYYNWKENIVLIREMIIKQCPVILVYNIDNKEYYGNSIVRYIRINNYYKMEFLSNRKNMYHKNIYSVPRCYQLVFYQYDISPIRLKDIENSYNICIGIFHKKYDSLLKLLIR